MDRAKAIKVLKPLVDSYVDYANITMKEEDDDIVEALEMAIEALKALDVPDFRAQEVFADCIEVLEILPSVQPEIIRCKDCKHRDKYGCCKYWKGLAMGDIPIATDDYDFCSYAKRI